MVELIRKETLGQKEEYMKIMSQAKELKMEKLKRIRRKIQLKIDLHQTKVKYPRRNFNYKTNLLKLNRKKKRLKKQGTHH